MFGNNIISGLARIKKLPIRKATSFEPEEIIGSKPDVKLSIDGQSQRNKSVMGKIAIDVSPFRYQGSKCNEGASK